MQISVPSPVTDPLELDAALLQAAITAGLAALSFALYRRYRKPWFAWWTVAWVIYVIRVSAIIGFLLTADRSLLLAHQVLTGWTALALLWTALVFSHGLRLRPVHALALLFPPLWSWVAVYRMDSFLLAAAPMVLFLSLATIWSGWVFLQYRRKAGAAGAATLGWALLLWGLHHLDYPFLRAQGAWAPWGYYLDIVFELAAGAGMLLLVLDDLERGVQALTALSGQLLPAAADPAALGALLDRAAALPGVHGAALVLRRQGDARVKLGVGASAAWTGAPAPGAVGEAAARAIATGRPVARRDDAAPRYTAALPIMQRETVAGALLLTGEVRDPFTALDDRFLLALGQQVGAALEHADLSSRLEARTRDLERLGARMVRQTEEERRRLSRELHDETAQLLGALKIELGLLEAGQVDPARVQRALALADAGLRSIRGVVNDLRPSLLDDLGLLPAMRSLATDVEVRGGPVVTFRTQGTLPPLSPDGELALYRGLQEGLANVARHADARHAEVTVRGEEGGVALVVEDDGVGMPDAPAEALERAGHTGLAGMRERLASLGGAVRVSRRQPTGTRLELRLPASAAAPHEETHR